MIDAFVALETQVWNALVAGDASADQRMLAEDFVGVYPTGLSDRAGHVAQLAEGPSIDSFTIVDPQLRYVAEDAVLLIYRASFRRPAAPADEAMYVSSLWRRRDGQWINTFSQDTPAE